MGLSNIISYEISEGWNILRFPNNYVEFWKNIEIQTNQYSIFVKYPAEFKLILKTVNGFLITRHSGTDGFRASEISLDVASCTVRVYSSNISFTSKGVIKISGILDV